MRCAIFFLAVLLYSPLGLAQAGKPFDFESPSAAEVPATKLGRISPKIAQTNPLIDWQLLQQLNDESETVWHELVRCNQDAEAARINYARVGLGNSDQLCETPDASKMLLTKTKALHGRVFDALQSSAFYKLEPPGILDYDGHKNSILLHPLLVQVLTETYVWNNAYPRLDSNSDRDRSARRSRAFQMELLVKEGILVGTPEEDAKLVEAKRILNTVILLGALSGDHCNIWGLWPRASRALFRSAGFTDGVWISALDGRVRSRVHRACARVEEGPYERDFYQGTHLELVRNFREMGSTYWETGTE